MFDFATSELLLVAIVALIVIGPKELPNALRQLGRMAGKARVMTRHLRAGFDEMVRQAELEEMEKEWRAHNARVMAETADAPAWPGPETPVDPMVVPAPVPATGPPMSSSPPSPPPPAPSGAGDGAAHGPDAPAAPPRPGPLP